MEIAKKVNNFTLLTNATTSNRELEKVLDALPFYTMLVDEDDNIVYANKAISHRFKTEPRSLVGGYCPGIIQGLGVPFSDSTLKKLGPAEKPAQMETHYSDKGRWMSLSVYPTELRTKKGGKIFLQMIEDISPKKKTEEKLRHALSRVHEITESAIRSISKIVESRDPYTALHQAKVGSIAYMIAKELGMSDKEADAIQVAGLLHDVGKSAVPIEILYKPGKLTKYEFEDIKNHSSVGYEILKDIKFDIPLADIALQHHERLDGSGYPNGLKGCEILREARIISVADVVDAMTSHRPYRQKRTMQETIDELEKNSGILYDPEVVKAAVKLCRADEIQPESLTFID